MSEEHRYLLVHPAAWGALVDHYDRIGIDIVRIPDFDDDGDEFHPTYILSPRSLGNGEVYPGSEVDRRRNT